MSFTGDRKDQHILINLDKKVTSGLTTGLEKYTFSHEALPEIDFIDVDTECMFLGQALRVPLMISSMTGGTHLGDQVNIHLAEAAETRRIALGIGSQRIMLESAYSGDAREVRRKAPHILLFSNIGGVQLNYGVTADDCVRLVELIEGNALFLHLNSLQEVLQPEGQTNFSNLAKKISAVCTKLPVPVFVKEVGWGISASTARRLIDLGVAGIDVAGAGGTSWSEVEKHRSNDERMMRISAQFKEWGIPTAEAVRAIHQQLPSVPLIASGGLKRGIDLAKSIALGASIGGFAGIFLRAAMNSTDKVVELIDEITLEFRITMFAAGIKNYTSLTKTKLIEKNSRCQ